MKAPYEAIVKRYIHNKNDLQMHNLCECIMQWIVWFQWLSLITLSLVGYHLNKFETPQQWAVFFIFAATISMACKGAYLPFKRLMIGYEMKSVEEAEANFKKWIES